MGEEGYSIVMTGFEGRLRDLWEASDAIFGPPGLDALGLVHGYHGKSYLPAELLAGLARERAEELARQLVALGARVEVSPSGEVVDVECRPSDIWPDKIVGRHCFTEIDGMVFDGSPLHVRANLSLSRKMGEKIVPWKYEWGENHFHVLGSRRDRETVRQGVACVGELAGALHEAYPSREFVISHLYGGIVSFYQAADDAPGEGVTFTSDAKLRGLCVPCQKTTDRLPLPQPDPEFPEAEWGRCSVCGNDVIIREPDVRILVSPGGNP
jgi:hypothetical protein